MIFLHGKYFLTKVFILSFLFAIYFYPNLQAKISIDSLSTIIKKAKENDKPILYLKFANEILADNSLTQTEYSVALEYCQKALELNIRSGNTLDAAADKITIGQFYYYQHDFKQSNQWTEQALKIYQAFKDKEGVATCFNLIGINYFYSSDINDASDFFEQSLKYSKGKYALEEGKSYFFQGLISRKQGKPDNAIEKLKNSIKPLKTSNDFKQLSKTYLFLGLLNYEKSQFPQAIEYYKTADSLRISNGDLEGSAITKNNIGNVYWSWGKYENAIAAYQDALRIFQKLGYKEGISSCLNNLGLLYNKMGNQSMSLESHKQALAIRKQTGDQSKVAESLNNIASVQYAIIEKEIEKKYGKDWKDNLYNKLSSKKILSFYNECLTNYNEALRIQDSLNNKTKIAQLYTNLGTIDQSAGNFDLAVSYYKKADEIYRNHNNIAEETSNKINLGIVYLKIGNYALSQKFLQDALTVAKDHKLNDLIKESYKNLSDLYNKQGDPANALESYKLYTEIKDTLLNAENYKQMAELQTQYETESQKQKIQILNKDKALQDTQIKQQKYTIFFFILVILLVSIMVVFIYRQSKQRKLANIELAKKNDLITEQKKEITDSIQYASRLQHAILPPNELFEQLLPQHFVFFKPRDIVSGDFYYLTEKDGKIILVTADCTGHGVPGAFMSMLGTALLNDIINKYQEITPGEILDDMRIHIIKSLHQSNRVGEHRDGMDVALFILDNVNNKIHFSGANNPLIIIRDGQLTELKPDKMPVGIYEKGSTPFTSQTFDIQKGDMLYTFSDGILDQFGGPDGKKFMIKRFRELLLNINQLDLKTQKEKLHKSFTEWKNNYEQVDDVTVIGVRV